MGRPIVYLDWTAGAAALGGQPRLRAAAYPAAPKASAASPARSRVSLGQRWTRPSERATSWGGPKSRRAALQAASRLRLSE